MTILAELKKPFNLLSTAIAVLSLLLSVYFYYESLQKREPYYLPHQSSQIYSKAVASPKITVIDGDGKPVSGDIHVLEVSFWNNGRLPIEPVDVRTPIFVEFPEGYRLLDSKIVRENKPTITAFKLSEVKSEMSSAPRVRLEWAHLDPGLGLGPALHRHLQRQDHLGLAVLLGDLDLLDPRLFGGSRQPRSCSWPRPVLGNSTGQCS